MLRAPCRICIEGDYSIEVKRNDRIRNSLETMRRVRFMSFRAQDLLVRRKIAAANAALELALNSGSAGFTFAGEAPLRRRRAAFYG